MAINVNINVSNLGAAVLSQNNPAAQSWIRVETNGAITLRTAAETLSDLGAQAAGAYVTAVTASGNIASSGGTTPNITFTGVLPTANGGTAVNIATTALTLGTASSAAGQLTLSNATSAFTQTIRGTNPAASVIYDLPTTAPTLGQVLSATAPAAGVVTLSWATASSGITINSTTITGGGANRMLFENSSNQVSESATNFYFTTASPFTHVFAANRTGTITGVGNSIFGYKAGDLITSGVQNTLLGYFAGSLFTNHSANTAIGWGSMFQTTGNENTAVGMSTLLAVSSGAENTSVGAYAGTVNTGSYNTYTGSHSGDGITSGSHNIGVGRYALLGKTTTSYSIHIGSQFAPAANSSNNNSTIAIGFNAYTTATHQGILGSNDANGYIDNWYYNGVTHTAPYSVTLNASGASGSNVAGCTYTHAGSKGTGSGTPGTLVFKTSTTLGSGTTLQSLVSRLTISGGAVTTDASTATWADALDFVFGTTTGTKIGTGTTQKIGFWNATPLAQQTTASAASTFVANTSLIANDTATFDGYTLGQVVKILRNLGILA